jgi:hypothetical protein
VNYDLDTKEGMQNSIDWVQGMMNLLKEGATWAIPRSECIYTVYPDRKIAIRVKYEEETDKVFLAMGWELREEL